MLTALFWLAFGALVILALVGWGVAGARTVDVRKLRAERADRDLRIASLEDKVAAADRQLAASGAADVLFARLLADGPSVSRGTQTDGDGVVIEVEPDPAPTSVTGGG